MTPTTALARTNAGWDAAAATDAAQFRADPAVDSVSSLHYCVEEPTASSEPTAPRRPTGAEEALVRPRPAPAEEALARPRPAPDEEALARPRPAPGVDRELWDLAATVVDPEVPVLTIEDLGVLRSARLQGGTAVVEITPTYSGCPAVEAIRADIRTALTAAGFAARVDVALSPAWTTDWMSTDGRRKLEEFGIAPPRPRGTDGAVTLGLGIRCPQCGSLHTREVSRFGSTSCKALWECRSCGEPFDRFKEL